MLLSRRAILFALALAVAGAGRAHGDTPKGTYSLGDARPAKEELDGKKLPVCSAADARLLASMVPLITRYGKAVEVNREPWIVDLESKDAVVARHPGYSKGLLVQLTFWRRERTAVASLHLLRLDGSGVPTCLVAFGLTGTFAPPGR